jgi:hypothetical protein
MAVHMPQMPDPTMAISWLTSCLGPRETLDAVGYAANKERLDSELFGISL